MMQKLLRAFQALILGLCLSVSATAAEYPKVINITYVKAPFNLQCMVMKHNQLLEKEFAKEGIRINWIPIKAGMDQVRGLAAGAIDMVSAMNTSTLLMANASGNGVLAVGGVAHPDDTFAIVAGKHTSIQRIEDLKGKTVVGPRGTVVHHLLSVALHRHGLSMNDVKFVSMNHQMSLQSLATQKVDAALLLGPGLMRAIQTQQRVLTRATGYLSTNLVLSARAQFVKDYPQVVQRVAQVNAEALRWIEGNYEQALKIGAAEHKISLDEARLLASWYRYYSTMEKADVQAMKNDQEFLVSEKMMSRPIDVESIIWPTLQ